MNNAERFLVGAIVVPLFVLASTATLNFFGVDGKKLVRHPAEQPPAVFAEKAEVATPKPQFNPFTAPESVQGHQGNMYTRFYCVKQTTTVDLTEGTVTTFGGSQVEIIEQSSADRQVASSVQTNMTVKITLGKKVTLPGMIIHTYATTADSVNAGQMSDVPKLTRLAAGRTDTIQLDTDKYVPNPLVNAISSITFCFM
jgi:hypothetical protein